MTNNQNQRPQFFEGQYLGAEDLSAAVDYSRIQAARHDLGAHTWGIAMGLQLKEKKLPGGQVEVSILPGYAWDGFGRPIVVLAPYRIPEAMFSDIAFQTGVDNTNEGKKGRLIPIWLRYNEVATQNVRSGFEGCDANNQHSRVQESFLIEIGAKPAHANQHDFISLAGQSVDAEKGLQRFDQAAPLVYDESIPHQLFPEAGERARWLIPIGYVRWLPVQNQPGHFVSRDDSVRPTGSPDLLKDSDKIRAFRRYIGVVAETIEAADGTIRLRDRTKPYSQVLSNDLVWIEGHLRVDGHIKLHTDGSLFALGGVENLRVIVGRVSTEGKGLGGSGFSAERSSEGSYSISFDNPFRNPPVVVVSPVSAAAGDKLLTISNLSASEFKVIAKDVISRDEGRSRDSEFTFIAMGLRS